MRKLFVLFSLVMLTGCSSFRLGAVLYCPHGQACELAVTPSEARK